MTNDTISDVLTRIRNAQRVGQRIVNVVNTRLTAAVLSVLKSEGFIESFEKKQTPESKFEKIAVHLKYFSNGGPVISNIQKVSKPGRRVYSGVASLKKVDSGLGVAIVSTPEGVMSDREARKRKVGGEVLAYIS